MGEVNHLTAAEHARITGLVGGWGVLVRAEMAVITVEIGDGHLRENLCSQSRIHLQPAQIHDMFGRRQAFPNRSFRKDEVRAERRISDELNAQRRQRKVAAFRGQAGFVGRDQAAALVEVVLNFARQGFIQTDRVGQDEHLIRCEITVRIEHIELVPAFLEHHHRAR